MTTLKQDYIGIGPKLPLTYDKKNGPFGLIIDPTIELKQNLYNLVMTDPGERVMDSNFGVGIRGFLFENFTSQTASEIRQRVYSQVLKYLPSVVVNGVDIQADQDRNTLYLRLEFFIPALGVTDTLSIDVEDTAVSL